MNQESQPVADITAGHWLPVPVYGRINDPYPGDATFVSSPGLPGAGDTFEVAMAPLAAPAAGPQTLTVRLRKTGACPAWAWVSLVDETDGGPVVIAARLVNPAAAFADYDLALTAGAAAQITNYGTLVLRVTAVRGGSSSCSEPSASGHSASGGSSGSSGGRSASSAGPSGSSASWPGPSVSASSASGGRSSGSSAGSMSVGSSFSSGNSQSSVSGSDASSGSQAEIPVNVPCCDEAAIPRTLFATVDGGAWSSLGTLQLQWDGRGWYNWDVKQLVCEGETYRVVVGIVCEPVTSTAWQWFVTITTRHTGEPDTLTKVPASDVVCRPLYVAGQLSPPIPCGGPIVVTVTEVEP